MSSNTQVPVKNKELVAQRRLFPLIGDYKETGRETLKRRLQMWF